jgi:hypothetical protein
MDRGRVAQAILGLAMPRDKAIASVGDLLEQLPQHGVAWFWRSVISLAARRVWRPLAAWPAATLAGVMLWGFLNRSATALHPFLPIDAVLSQLAWLLAIVALWCLLQYGWKDPSAQAASLWAVALTAGIAFRWIPLMSGGMFLATLASTAYRAIEPYRRRIILALLLSLPLPWIALNMLFFVASRFRLPDQQAAANRLLTVSLPLLTIVVFVSVSSMRRLFCAEGPDPERV